MNEATKVTFRPSGHVIFSIIPCALVAANLIIHGALPLWMLLVARHLSRAR